jgi:hypothetical protein
MNATPGCFIPHPSRVQAVLDVTESLISPVRPEKPRVAFSALCRTCADDPTTSGAVEARRLGEAGSCTTPACPKTPRRGSPRSFRMRP